MRDAVADAGSLGALSSEHVHVAHPPVGLWDLCAAALVSDVCIDAGVSHLRLMGTGEDGAPLIDRTLASDERLRGELLSWRSLAPFRRSDTSIVISGKLAPLVHETIGCGVTALPAAAAWFAARDYLSREPDPSIQSLAVIELSASGYLLIGVDRSGALKDDLLVVNPRCGAGSGVNLDRVLQKLGLGRSDVDPILQAYAGDQGRELRNAATVRADRCGVFSSSATISDKNQGIPLDVALATTLKSEVLKACRKLPRGFDQVCLTGRVFHWRFARECAEDWLHEQGVRRVTWDPDNTQALASLRTFARNTDRRRFAVPDARLQRRPSLDEYPAMAQLKRRYETEHRYLRQPDLVLPARPELLGRTLHIALDVGSTMAKAALADAESGEILWLGTRSNAGDTIEIIKQLLREVAAMGCTRPQVRGIGITGSARYQVQRALEHIYPELAGRVVVLVENYAHARGSIALAREHVQHLKAIGETAVNEDFCILVDIGGEDTKVSTIALKQAELFGNVMNLKCSAGTGSLMDTLVSMFGLTDVASACAQAFAARRAVAINATCAVFLMENARKLQLQGVPRDEILASANWAIVENMARTLWNQIELPANAVVLLHGQTMLSEPLPIAVTHRLQSCGVASSYALVPPNPGHRACLGLLATLRQVVPASGVDVNLARFFDARFDRRIVQCHGAVCDDKAACCNRSRLTCSDAEGHKVVSFMVGGCSAVNELIAKKEDKSAAPPVRDTYKELWDFIDGHHPRSERADRLVIPRSFAVSEWAFLFARLFERLGIPVFVDKVRESDLAAAQPLFHIDTCAPHIGAVGQFRRLAGEPHGLILAMQIEFLPTGGSGAGRTCTLNQGGVGVALNLARLAHPEARFQLVNVDLSVLEAEALRVQLQERLAPVFLRYGVAADADTVRDALSGAIEDHLRLRAAVADLAAEMAEEALAQSGRVAVVVGREYLLNPGIYDSHVRRLLRDKRMTVLPSFALDVELNPDYAHIYWRNPHAIVSLIDAVSRRQLHLKLRHARLREVFRTIEEGRDLLPLVQVSTFSCGPDSVVQPFVAEIVRQRPFLLIQSDAVIKELAHLENRVNTYIRQLELGLHQRLKACGADRFEILALADLLNKQRVDRSTDVIYFPTLGDNRVLTATLRGAGYTCIDNYDEREYDLGRLVRAGRGTVGDAACAPLAAVYADLERAIDDFARRRRAGDPLVAGKRRLLYFDNKGAGPCRQGQYFDAHRLLFHRSGRQGRRTADHGFGGPDRPDSPVVQFLVGIETEGYDIGIEEWALARAHQGAVLHGVLQSLLFTGGASCRDHAEYEALMADFRALKEELYRAQEAFHGPGEATAAVLKRLGKITYLGPLLKYIAYGLSGRGLVKPLRRFADQWIRDRALQGECIRIALTGEVYMRAAQGEEIFRVLLANLGFRRFQLEYTPVWNYLDYGLEEAQEIARDQIGRLMAEAGSAKPTRAISRARASLRRARTLTFILRELVARPLYTAARLPMPVAAGSAMRLTRELLPTLRPLSETATYIGEVIGELRHGADLVLNVAPNGCMVATMGEALTPAITHAADGQRGRVQHLFSADGDVDQELLTLALLKVMGPDGYYGAERFVRQERSPETIESTRLLASAACPP
ncbi:MAG: hypothetical protein JSW36_04765 [Burkholderiales bacterium]|nr:MAG: hypothetical protein JSW36_04765 [Burkholderiales bacterium]